MIKLTTKDNYGRKYTIKFPDDIEDDLLILYKNILVGLATGRVSGLVLPKGCDFYNKDGGLVVHWVGLK